MRILIADNVAASADSLAEVLRRGGNEPVAMYSGNEVLERIEDLPRTCP